jgi:hypothetical protein
VYEPLFDPFVSAAKIPFPRTKTETLFEPAVQLLRGKAEHLVLTRPFRWQVGEASNAHAMRQPAIDCKP